jgi:glyoxylase-like metal-dependent hydrolase (beta-lactamase superfamily II)/rhodanese-related sulfurtransferase
MTPTITVEELRALLEKGAPVTILDIRPTQDFLDWHIPGSLHVDAYDALKAHDPAALTVVELPTDQPVVTVCASGKISQIAADFLAAHGFHAFSLEGGMKAWSLAWSSAEITVNNAPVHIIQVRRTGKGCLSYLIGIEKEAFVIDASLDPQVYLDLARNRGWHITRVFDTHIHADHLSRSRQLAERSGAILLLPDQQRVSFPFTALHDGDTIVTKDMLLTALHTPGHTLESTCYLLNHAFLFTGDTLFSTSVGRPDLHADEQEARARAALLYHSLHKLLALPAETFILPGHTSQPVPFDGVPIGARLAEIDEQVDLLHVRRTVFVETLIQRLPPTPPNYERITQLNEAGFLPDEDITELEAGANRCAIT